VGFQKKIDFIVKIGSIKFAIDFSFVWLYIIDVVERHSYKGEEK